MITIDPTEKHQKLDDLFDEAGHFGRWQKLMIVLVGFVMMSTSVDIMITVFTLAESDNHCNVPYDESLLPTLPRAAERCPGVFVADSCSEYQDPYDSPQSGELVNCQNGSWFEESPRFWNSAIPEFDLVCDRHNLKALTQLLYFVAQLISSSFAGLLIDGLGRRKTCLIVEPLRMVGAIICGLAPSYPIYIVGRMVSGAGSGVTYGAVYCLVYEATGPNVRATVALLCDFFWTTGWLLTALAAYMLPYWRHLCYFQAAMSFTAVCCLLLFDESPSFVFATLRDVDRTEQIFKRVARLNGRNPDNVRISKQLRITVEEKKTDAEKATYTFIDLFTNGWPLARTALTMWFLWTSVACIFTGYAYDVEMVPLDLYLTNIVYAALGYPQIILAMFFTRSKYFKRRGTHALCLGTAAVATFLIMAFNELAYCDLVDESHDKYENPLVILSIASSFVGKFFAETGFMAFSVYTMEIFPVPLRGNGVAFGLIGLRVGMIIAPIILGIEESISWFPLAVFGTLGLASVFATFILPDTFGVPSPVTIEEATYFYTHKKPYQDKNSHVNEVAVDLNDEQT